MRIESKRIEQEFTLKSDPLGEARVTFRQARFGETVRRGDLQARRRQIYRTEGNQGETVVEQDWNFFKQQAQEIFLVITKASGFITDKGEELFQFKEKDGISSLDMGEVEFYRALEKLDDPTIDEMHKCVLKVNPQWNPSAAGE